MVSGKIKAVSSANRPDERCLKAGPASLTDAELLAVILRTGTTGKNAIDLADDILNLNRTETGLPGLSSLTAEELMKLPGIGHVKAVQILCVAELSRRTARARARERLNFSNAGTIAEYYMEELRTRPKECVCLMLLDTRGGLIADRLLTIGTVNQSLVSPRDIFVEALRYQAVSIILVHNHPSGDPAPSEADRLITRQIASAGELMAIPLLDHVIIGSQCYFSFRQEGLLGPDV